jgi:hypothetical protein
MRRRRRHQSRRIRVRAVGVEPSLLTVDEIAELIELNPLAIPQAILSEPAQ